MHETVKQLDEVRRARERQLRLDLSRDIRRARSLERQRVHSDKAMARMLRAAGASEGGAAS